MQKKYLYIYFTEHSSPSTAIHIGKHRVSSDPRSQANDGAVSTMMGDRMGILRAVVFTFLYSEGPEATCICTRYFQLTLRDYYYTIISINSHVLYFQSHIKKTK